MIATHRNSGLWKISGEPGTLASCFDSLQGFRAWKITMRFGGKCSRDNYLDRWREDALNCSNSHVTQRDLFPINCLKILFDLNLGPSPWKACHPPVWCMWVILWWTCQLERNGKWWFMLKSLCFAQFCSNFLYLFTGSAPVFLLSLGQCYTWI